jgi:hypothetical protein
MGVERSTEPSGRRRPARFETIDSVVGCLDPRLEAVNAEGRVRLEDRGRQQQGVEAACGRPTVPMRSRRRRLSPATRFVSRVARSPPRLDDVVRSLVAQSALAESLTSPERIRQRRRGDPDQRDPPGGGGKRRLPAPQDAADEGLGTPGGSAASLREAS